jgi:hypothetical protein
MAEKMSMAERLDKCIAALGPEMAEHVAKGWGPQGAPYEIRTLPNGRTRLSITDHYSGDMYVGAGATLEEALTALEAKVLQTASLSSAPAPTAQGGA